RLGELGALGLVVPEALGGSGAGHVERAVVAEELGRSVAPSPFLGSAVLAVDTLLALGGGADLLPGLASGELLGAVAVGGAGLLGPGGATARDGSLRGTLAPVVDGVAADVLLVYADTADEPAFFRVDADAPGLTRTALSTLDHT